MVVEGTQPYLILRPTHDRVLSLIPEYVFSGTHAQRRIKALPPRHTPRVEWNLRVCNDDLSQAPNPRASRRNRGKVSRACPERGGYSRFVGSHQVEVEGSWPTSVLRPGAVHSVRAVIGKGLDAGHKHTSLSEG